MLRRSFIGAIACLCVIGSVRDLTVPLRPRLLYNPSPSAPIGWYALARKDVYRTGAQVAAFAPDTARELAHKRGYLSRHDPLIKILWAGPGETVCRQRDRISAANRASLTLFFKDSAGRDMPHWSGCFILGEGEYFIASPDHDQAWDSRYFGPVTSDHILGQVHYLGQNLLSSR